MMGVAERMGERSGEGSGETVQLAVGLEAVVDDDAPFEAFRHLAALAEQAR